MKKLAIISTHPIQYNAPLFELLDSRKKVQPHVFYTWPQAAYEVRDREFKKIIKWDIPLLRGYDYSFVSNISKNPNSKSWNGIITPTLIDEVKDFQPDIILVYGWKLKGHFQAMKYFKGKIPVLFRGDSTLLNNSRYSLQAFARFATLKWVFQFIDVALYVGYQNKKYFLKHGLKEQQLAFVPHAVDNARFMGVSNSFLQEQAEEYRRVLGYKSSDIVLLYAGKFLPLKQVDILLNAFELAVQEVPELKILLVGEGQTKKRLEAAFQHLSGVKFLGFQNQSIMPIIYRVGDAFCLCSRSETWGLAINEAMACSKPVIVSDMVGCAKDLVHSDQNGYIFSHRNEQQLAAILTSLNKNKLRQMGKRSLKIIKEWSFDKQAEKIESLANAF